MEETLLSASPFIREGFNFSDLMGKRVLDLGCGDGVLSCLFAKHGAITTAIDITTNGIKLTARNARLQGVALDVVNCDAEKMAFADNSFDYVFSWGVIHHTRSTEDAAKEIFRVLKSKRRGLVMVYHRSSFIYYLKGLWLLLAHGKIFHGDTLKTVQRYYVDGFYHRHFTKSELRKCLDDAGLETHNIFSTQQEEKIFPFLPRPLDNFLKFQFGWYLVAEFIKNDKTTH